MDHGNLSFKLELIAEGLAQRGKSPTIVETICQASAALHKMAYANFETAPKDGSWFRAYRPEPEIGHATRIVDMAWFEPEGDFIYPAEQFDIINGDCSALAETADFYWANEDFTHWKPAEELPSKEKA